MLNKSEKIKFWDTRIIAWEERHYKTSFSSISQRQQLALHLLRLKAKGLKVLEIGCGSARLAESIIAYGADSYTGIDLSSAAIKNAASLNSNLPRCRFLTGDLDIASGQNFDLVFSLGLMDWLNKSEQRQLALLSQDKLYLHSFTEKILFTSFLNLLHKLYSKTYTQVSKYAPVHQHRSEIQSLFSENVKIIRSPKMFISSFVTNI